MTKIKFCCINSKQSETECEKGGVGLKSVQQRLNLIYPNRHKLVIDDGEKTYSVWLELSLTNKKNDKNQLQDGKQNKNFSSRR